MGQSRVLALRRAGVCVSCDTPLTAGTRAYWHADRKAVECLGCRPERVVPGASAQRIAAQRHERRDRAVRAAHPRIGGLLLAVSKPPQPEQAWVSGAIGERVVGTTLDSLAEGRSMIVLHDRRRPGATRANIDHIAVAASGIWVIDAKRYRDQLVDSRVRQLRPTLTVAGRARPELAEGVLRQARAIKALVDGVCPVYAVLCFVDARWPPFGTSFVVQGVRVCPPSRLRKLLLGRGPVTDDGIADIARTLTRNLPPA
jgi:hypothetical protein